MTVASSIDPTRLLEEQLAQASPDLLRELLGTFINTLVSAGADSVCGAEYGVVSPDRVNRRNGYRHRDFDTRVGTVDVAIPKLRQGTYFPEWLLEHRKRAERALTSVVATCYLLGVSTRRMDKAADGQGGGWASWSPHWASPACRRARSRRWPRDLDAAVDEFRTRSLAESGPFTFVAADALVLKVREGGRVVPVHALVATGVNADGHREILGIQVTTSEDGAGWLAFFRDLTARGLSGVRLVTSDAHAGLTAAIAATLAGASWQRCRTHYAANLMLVTPKSSWGWVKALLHSIYAQPDAESVHAQFDRVVDALAENSPPSQTTSTTPEPTSSPSPASPRKSGDKSGPTTPTNASPARSAAAPTSSASSPTAPPSSDSSARSWPSNTTSGPKAPATSDSTSSPAPKPPTTPPPSKPSNPPCKPSQPDQQQPRRITPRTPLHWT
jgi:putative transposase